jgi:hypothetical protein
VKGLLTVFYLVNRFLHTQQSLDLDGMCEGWGAKRQRRSLGTGMCIALDKATSSKLNSEYRIGNCVSGFKTADVRDGWRVRVYVWTRRQMSGIDGKDLRELISVS